MRRAVQALAADAAAAELLPALDGRSIPALVLRGPAIAHWFYRGSWRSYSDLDLLVRRSDQARATELLLQRGFKNVHADLNDREIADLQAHGHIGTHATTWARADTLVDLHVTLNHVGVPPERVWDELWCTAEPIQVAGHTVPVPGRAAAGFIVAVHAAAHGSGYRRTREDLAHALECMPGGDWEHAAELARRLDAVGEFSAGLALLPKGADISRTLGLERAAGVETRLRAAAAPPTAIGFERLSAAPGAGAKLSLLAGEIVPPPAFMRSRFAVARRGRVGLAAAYLWRPLSLALHAGAGFLAWRREREVAR